MLKPMVAEVCTYLLNVVYSGEPMQIWPQDGDITSDGLWYVSPKLDGFVPVFVAHGIAEAMLWCQVNGVDSILAQTPTTTLNEAKLWRRKYRSPLVWRPGEDL